MSDPASPVNPVPPELTFNCPDKTTAPVPGSVPLASSPVDPPDQEVTPLDKDPQDALAPSVVNT